MAAIIGFLLAKLTSPDIIIISLIGGFISNKWWHLLVTAIVAAFLSDFLLRAFQQTRSFDIAIFAIAMNASFFWAGVAILIRYRRSKAKSQT
mgnify:CR=1 FL=1